MNLFDQISGKSSLNSFLGKTPTPPANPSYGVFPQAPMQQQPTNRVPQVQSSFIPTANAWQKSVSDDEILKMIDAGATDDEIKTMIQEIEAENAPLPEQSFLDKSLNVAKKSGEFIQNAVWWAVAEAPKVLWNIAEYVSKASQYHPVNLGLTAIQAWFSDKTYGQLRDEQKKSTEVFSKVWEQGKQLVEKYGAYNPNSIGAKVWWVWVDIAATLAWPWKFFKTAQEANKAIKALAAIGNLSLEWTTQAVSNYIASEGRMPTAREVWEFIAVNWAVRGTSKIASELKKLPSARLIPTTISEAWKDIRMWVDIWEAISKTGVSFTKWQLLGKLENKITTLSNLVDKHIDDFMKAKWPNNMTISDITKGIKEFIMKDATIAKQLQGTPIQKQWIMDTVDETIEAYKKLYGAKNFDIAGQQQLKKDIYTWLTNVFNKTSPTARVTAEQATERQIASNLRQNIETKIPEVGKLNDELSPLLEASNRLRKKWDYKTLLIDSIIGASYASSQWNPINDPVWYIKNFALWVITKHIWTSTVAKTSASTILRRTEQLFDNKQFQKLILDQYRTYNSNHK